MPNIPNCIFSHLALQIDLINFQIFTDKGLKLPAFETKMSFQHGLSLSQAEGSKDSLVRFVRACAVLRPMYDLERLQ